MSSAWLGVIVPLAIIAALALVILGVFIYVRLRLRKFSQEAFGTPDFVKGAKELEKNAYESPKSIRSMTSIYLPQIQKDFPEFDYDLYKEKTKSVLRGYFDAIADKSTSSMTEECTLAMKNHVQGVIEDLNRRGYTQYFNEVVIHNVDIARYLKNGATVTILMNAAVGLYDYIKDDNGKLVFGREDSKRQAVYDVALVYIQDVDKMNVFGGDAMGISCPNCGAPIKNLGQKFCEYCGTGVVEVNTRSWFFDSIKENSSRKSMY